ncbi:MAG: hypothetical protein ABIE22_02810 [archaeon]
MAEGEIVVDILKEVLKPQGEEYSSGPLEEHQIVYDSSSETLEPIYFWILDKMQELAGPTEKLIDNFVSSPGSGHFSELMGKATHMQKEAMTAMGTINTLIRSVVNIIYDLKEFKIKLSHYDAAKSKNSQEAEAGLLALKQLWMDNVDVKRGNTGIKAMAAQFSYVTVIDAFMVAKSLEDIDKMDLNDRVKRFLKPRIQEFFEWKKRSEQELKKRYEIEKTYLKSQVNSLKLYTKWVKPYLKAASQLQQKDTANPAIVTTFNTVLLELSLFGKKPLNISEEVTDKNLPLAFNKIKLKKDYYPCILVDFVFRGIPQKAGQHYVFGGKAYVTFRGYALSEEELKMLQQKLEESSISEALKLAKGATEDSLDQLKDDLEYFLEEESEEDKKESKSEDTDPFSALFSGLFSKKAKKPKKGEEAKIEKIKKDNYQERVIRELAAQKVRESTFTLFDIYKKSHGMASHPGPYE